MKKDIKNDAATRYLMSRAKNIGTQKSKFADLNKESLLKAPKVIAATVQGIKKAVKKVKGY